MIAVIIQTKTKNIARTITEPVPRVSLSAQMTNASRTGGDAITTMIAEISLMKRIAVISSAE